MDSPWPEIGTDEERFVRCNENEYQARFLFQINFNRINTGFVGSFTVKKLIILHNKHMCDLAIIVNRYSHHGTFI